MEKYKKIERRLYFPVRALQGRIMEKESWKNGERVIIFILILFILILYRELIMVHKVVIVFQFLVVAGTFNFLSKKLLDNLVLP